MLTVLLTDGAFTGLIRALRHGYGDNIRIIGLSEDPNTAHQALLDGFYVVPAYNAPEYISVLLSILKKETVNIIFPIISEGIEDLLKHEALILEETGAKILSSPLSAIQIANDKGDLYSFLQKDKTANLCTIVPEFRLAHTKKELLDGIAQLTAMNKPVCIKRRRGEDAAGFWIIDTNGDQAEDLFYNPPKRKISMTSLLNKLNQLQDTDSIPPYMVSEFLPGEEWDCDVLCLNGQLISVTTRINLQMSGGLTSLLEVRENQILAQYCQEIVAALNLSYVVCISFKAKEDGQFAILEINPRMMGNIFVSTLAGNNYAKMAIELMQGIEIQPIPPRTGIRTALYYDQLVIK